MSQGLSTISPVLHCNINNPLCHLRSRQPKSSNHPKEPPMNTTAEQFIATNKANLQALEVLTAQAYAGFEKFVELNLAASKAALGESFSHVQSILGAKDAQELIALQSALLKPLAEKSAAYAQHVQTIVTGSGAEFIKAVEAKTAVEVAQSNFTAVATQTADAVKKATKAA